MVVHQQWKQKVQKFFGSAGATNSDTDRWFAMGTAKHGQTLALKAISKYGKTVDERLSYEAKVNKFQKHCARSSYSAELRKEPSLTKRN